MNIIQIKEKISELMAENKSLSVPYHMLEDAISQTIKSSNLDIYTIKHTDIHFYKVINFVESLLNHLQIEYDIPKNETDGNDIYKVYEDFILIYEELQKLGNSNLWLYEELLGKEVSLAERSYIQLGTTEGRMVGMLEKLTDNLGAIVDVINDDKKLDKKLKIVKKNFPNFDKLIGEIGKIKIAEFMEKASGVFGKNKEVAEVKEK